MSHISWECDRLPGTSPTSVCGPAIVRRINTSTTLAALFTGSLWGHAAHALETSLHKSASGVVPEISSLMADAAQKVDEYLESQDEDSRLYDWSAGACGVVIVVSSGVARFVWLGDVQVFHVRAWSIVNSLAAHTLSNALREAGHEIADKRYHHVLLKWLSQQHDPTLRRGCWNRWTPSL